MPDAIFLGLVTHPATRFTAASSPAGLLPSLQALLATQGTQAQLSIHATDEWTENTLPIDRAVVEASIDAELDIEKRWRRYIDPSVPKLLLDVFMAIRRIYRRRKFLPCGRQELEANDPGFQMVRRLVNIEIAHMSLLKQAATSNTQWTLIAEDDATSSEPSALAQALTTFIREQAPNTQPKYVNVSRSFNHRRLRVRDLLQPIGSWGEQTSGIEVLQARRPITNTVCAILYRTDFLATLVHTMNDIPLEPVVPIDWKLNAAIMQMHDSGELSSGDCWILDPAPIVQSSMVDPR